MKKVLITGASGFIGRHLVEGMLKEKIEVYAVVKPENKGFTDVIDSNLHLMHIDINDICHHVNDFPKDIDVFYHLAWNGVTPNLRNNEKVQISNISMTMKCMEAAYLMGIKKIIFPGSTNEYLYYGKPLNKYAVPSPNNIYGATKIALRYLCEVYAVNHNIDYIYTIIAGIYAADRKDNNVIYYTIDKLLNKEKPFLTKLEQLWDYVYIDDVINALIAIGNKGREGAVYAIGHGDNWPLSNYIKLIHKAIDDSLPLGIGEIPYDSDQLPCSCIDLTDLKKDTGFSPRIDFEEGISLVIQQIKQVE